MSNPLPTAPSRRLLRAAEAERADLLRHRDRVAGEREAALARVRDLDQALGAIERRLAVLGQLIEGEDAVQTPAALGSAPASPPPPGAAGESAPLRTAADESAPLRAGAREAAPLHAGAGEPEPTPELLRGPAIRELAVQVLLSQPERIDALHYRRWYELVCGAGYEVAGKDPLAVFLTQMTRSPVVRKASEAGVYEVDRQAPARIRRRLERLQAELREVTVSSEAPVDLATVRARRHELDLAISQQERALEEAVRVLGRDDLAPAASATNTYPAPSSRSVAPSATPPKYASSTA